MFKLFIMAVVKKLKSKKKTIQEKWRENMAVRGIKQSWVAGKAGFSQEHLSNILAGRVLLTEENKEKINEVLGTDFK